MTDAKLLDFSQIHSEFLGELRKVELFKEFLGPIAQFVVVIDANVLLGDLIWLVSKRKNPNSVTQLMECIISGTFIAYITRSVLAEVNEKIPLIAVNKGLSGKNLKQEWEKYRKLLKVRTPPKAQVNRYREGQDPDDAPTIALEKTLDSAVGIISKDTDITPMGGLVLEIDFTRKARDYSRKTAVAISIKYCGGLILTSTIITVEVILEIIKAIIPYLNRVPTTLKIIIFIAFFIFLNNKQVKKFIIDLIKNNETIPYYWSLIVKSFVDSLEQLAQNTVPAPVPTYKTAAKHS